MNKHRTLSLLNFLFQRSLKIRNVESEPFLTGSRSFSRARQIPESIGRKQAASTRDEYKQRMFERARQRRSSILEKERSVDPEDNTSSTAVMVHSAVQEQNDESTEEEDEVDEDEADEEEALDEYGLFFGLINYEQPTDQISTDRYVPFQISEDDEEHGKGYFVNHNRTVFSVESDKEDDPTEQWFANMEEDVKLAKEEEQALYPEEEVPVKVFYLLVRDLVVINLFLFVF